MFLNIDLNATERVHLAEMQKLLRNINNYNYYYSRSYSLETCGTRYIQEEEETRVQS